MSRALYSAASVREFLDQDPSSLSKQMLGELVASTGFDGDASTLDSYRLTISQLQESFSVVRAKIPDVLDWAILMEFQIPRRQKRIDAVILANDRIVVAEFKTGVQAAGRGAEIQVEDYALDLRDFHETSRGRLIIPVVIGNRKDSAIPQILPVDAETKLTSTATFRPSELPQLWEMTSALENPLNASRLDMPRWQSGRYAPVPTIIEAALRLYQNHGVKDIASSAAGSENLTETVSAIRAIVASALESNQRCVCFVTGVPGSGKTLAGLTAVHATSGNGEKTPAATFLSGNVPLVKVLREALVRDAQARDKHPREVAEREVFTFIENIHAFARYYWKDQPDSSPINRVIVFDESQRAWDRQQMLKKQKIDLSEPELLLNIMGRNDAAVVIALVGGGQEIHKGEAGLRGWGEAIEADGRWKIYASPEVVDGSVEMAGSRLFDGEPPNGVKIALKRELHLRVPRRTIGGQTWNDWAEAFLRCDFEKAAEISCDFGPFTARVTRDLQAAKEWVRARTRGTRRGGMVSSSGNLRGRPFGIEVSSGFRQGIDWAAWFLNVETDVRSSSYLEIPASEFECQGLEVDEAILCWGGDMHLEEKADRWTFCAFKGKEWQGVKKVSDQNFILSKYRVLLTRARGGIVIWIPPSVDHDPTIKRQQFDRLYDALIRSGISPILGG